MYRLLLLYLLLATSLSLLGQQSPNIRFQAESDSWHFSGTIALPDGFLALRLLFAQVEVPASRGRVWVKSGQFRHVYLIKAQQTASGEYVLEINQAGGPSYRHQFYFGSRIRQLQEIREDNRFYCALALKIKEFSKELGDNCRIWLQKSAGAKVSIMKKWLNQMHRRLERLEIQAASRNFPAILVPHFPGSQETLTTILRLIRSQLLARTQQLLDYHLIAIAEGNRSSTGMKPAAWRFRQRQIHELCRQLLRNRRYPSQLSTEHLRQDQSQLQKVIEIIDKEYLWQSQKKDHRRWQQTIAYCRSELGDLAVNFADYSKATALLKQYPDLVARLKKLQADSSKLVQLYDAVLAGKLISNSRKVESQRKSLVAGITWLQSIFTEEQRQIAAEKKKLWHRAESLLAELQQLLQRLPRREADDNSSFAKRHLQWLQKVTALQQKTAVIQEAFPRLYRYFAGAFYWLKVQGQVQAAPQKYSQFAVQRYKLSLRLALQRLQKELQRLSSIDKRQ